MHRSRFLIGLAAAAVIMTGCSNSASGSGEEVAAPSDPAEVSGDISYAIWDITQQPGMEELVDDFNQTYPNVNVSIEVTAYAQYFTKLQTQGSSDNLPDVFWMNGPNLQLFASNEMLAPLTPFEDEGLIDPANYPEAMNDIYTYEDVQYGVPKDFDTIALWYNKKILADAGVEPPTEDWTWEDYRAAAKTITEKLGDQGIIGTGDNYDMQAMVYPAILSNGGTILNDGSSGYSDPKTMEALQFWTDMVADGSMQTPAANADTPGLTKFLNGEAGLMWSGNWQVAALLDSAVKDDVTAVPLPLAPSGERKTVIHGIGNVLSAKSAGDPAAQAFLTYLGSEDAALIQATSGVANPAFNNTQQAYVDSVPGYNLQVFEDAATEYSLPYPVSMNTGAWNKFETELLPTAFSGERPVAEVAEELSGKVDEALAKEK